jgi:Uncharacterised nucleotidyltransferase
MRSTPPLPTAERAFLLGTLFHGALDLPRLRALAAGPIDWPVLVNAAEAHFLGAVLFDSLHAAGVAASVPAPLLARLRAEAARVATRNATLLRAAGRACQLLAADGVEVMALKGTGLAVHASRYFSIRHQSDVDLLVARERARVAARLLLAGGFAPAPAYAHLVGLDGRSPLDETSPLPPGHHLLPLVSPEGATVELHFELPGRLPPEALEAVWAGTSVGPGGIRTSGKDALLGLLCAHVHVHHEREPAFLLRHVADVVVLVAAGGSLERARRAFGPSVDASRLLVEEARCSVGEPGRRAAGLAEAALAGRHWRLRHPVAAWRIAFRGRWAMLLDGGLQALCPSPRFMAQRYGMSVRSPLLPLAYPWRFLSALGRALLGR